MLGLVAHPASARMSDKDKAAAAAIAILGIAALVHGNHHYTGGYEPDDGDSTAEFERGYRDGVMAMPTTSTGARTTTRRATRRATASARTAWPIASPRQTAGRRQ